MLLNGIYSGGGVWGWPLSTLMESLDILLGMSNVNAWFTLTQSILVSLQRSYRETVLLQSIGGLLLIRSN